MMKREMAVSGAGNGEVRGHPYTAGDARQIAVSLAMRPLAGGPVTGE